MTRKKTGGKPVRKPGTLGRKEEGAPEPEKEQREAGVPQFSGPAFGDGAAERAGRRRERIKNTGGEILSLSVSQADHKVI